jgi:hypothetical protein
LKRTFEDIEQYGEERFLEEVQRELSAYGAPSAVRGPRDTDADRVDAE